MSRIRSIKPDFFQSEDVSALPLRARLTWIGLWTHCDDHGRTKDIARLIKGWIWSMDDASLRDVETDLAALADAGRIVRYQVDGKSYLAITNWHRHQSITRPSRPKHPAPPVVTGCPGPAEMGHCETCWDTEGHLLAGSHGTHERLTESSVKAQERLTPGREGKGREGKGVVDDADDADPERPDVERLCAHLADRIEANGSKRPPITKGWRTSARLTLDRDGRTEDQVRHTIDWCQDDEFWRANVLSMPKLREKYDQLRLQASKRNGRPGSTEKPVNPRHQWMRDV